MHGLALSAQFQHHGSEVLSLRLHGYAAQGRAAGEEHQVVAVFEQFPVHHTVALHHGHVLLREGIGNELLKDLGDVGDVRGRLKDGRATGRYGPHQGVQKKLHGIVPGANDERAAQRFPHNVAGGREHGERGTFPLAAGPLAHLADGLSYLSVHQAQFRHEGLLVTFVKVLPEGFAKGFFPFGQALVEVL